MSLNETSKFISLILRHKPEVIGISLDEHGWANVSELIEGISKQQPFDMAMLEEIVATDNKQRYSFNEDHTLIRANQGHSIPVDVELPVVEPPESLFHGTGEKSQLPSTRRDFCREEGCMSIFPAIWKPQGKWGHVTESRLSIRSGAVKWHGMG